MDDVTLEEIREDARGNVSELVTREFPDSVLLASDVDRIRRFPDSFGKVKLSCYRGRVHAFLPMFAPRDGHGDSGVATDAGPCPCGGDRAGCRFLEVGLPSFDLAEAVRQAARMAADADSLPRVTRHVRCPKDCREDHNHERYGGIAIVCTTMMDQLIPYARRCVRYSQGVLRRPGRSAGTPVGRGYVT